MVESPMPQDILKYKAKFIANFTARQVVFVMVGVAVGIATWFMTGGLAMNVRIVVAGIVGALFASPGFIFIFGQPIEKVLPAIITDNFLAPAVRKKETHFPELEKFERSRAWRTAEENAEAEENAANKKKKKKVPKQDKIAKSKNYPAIK